MELALQTFTKFTEDLRLILRKNLFEIIIHGSYVLDDFRANLGDLDFIVLTNANLDEESNKNLSSLHEKYRSEKALLLHQLEGTYYPKSFMENPENPLFGLYIGTSKMKSITSRQNSFMDLRLVNQHGLKLLGTNCNTYNPIETEMLTEQESDSMAFKQTISQTNSLDIGFWISLILWSARTLFYRANRIIGSKTEACQWCLEQSELEEYHELFDYAEKLRYPYQEGMIKNHNKNTCMNLLDMVNVQSNNKSNNRIEPTSTASR